jgi:AAA+ ATPase superfamily predicted ATPase
LKQKNSSNSLTKFSDILELIVKEQIDEKLILIIDDFQELLKIDKTVSSTIYKYWIEQFKYQNLQLIILSNTKQHQTNLLDISNSSFHIQPIPFENINSLKSVKWIDKLFIYSFFGTSDLFLRYYNTKLDFIKNIYNISLDTNSPFFKYGLDYLKKDISDISTYCSILYAISKGHNKIGQIASAIDLKSTDLSRYIKKLQELFIITKELPISNNFQNSKFGRYYINDHYLKFWFCYIFENISLLQMKKYQPVLKLINTNFIKDIIEPAYKKFILNIIKHNPKKYLGYTPTQIGKWWDNTQQIDIIAHNDKQITFISIVWDTADVAKLHYGTLKSIANSYTTDLKRNYIIISKNTYMNMKEQNG